MCALPSCVRRTGSTSGKPRSPGGRPRLVFTEAPDAHTSQVRGSSPPPTRVRRPPTATLRRMRSLHAMRAASQIRRPDTDAAAKPHARELRRKQHTHLMRYRRAMLEALDADDLLQQLGLGSSPRGGGGTSPGTCVSCTPPLASQHVWKAELVRLTPTCPSTPPPLGVTVDCSPVLPC